MVKLSSRVKKIPSLEALQQLKWYVVFVGTANNIRGIENILKDNDISNGVVWAPTFQEYHKFRSHLVAIDKLLYPGYVFVGFENIAQVGIFLRELSSESKGLLLGDGAVCLTMDEINDVLSVVNRLSEAPKMMIDIKTGDQVTINSGPLSGLPATVTSVTDSGDVVLNIFFLSRELEVKTTILDIQGHEHLVNDND